MTMPHANDVRRQFLQDGFVVVPDFLSADLLARANAEMSRHFAAHLTDGKAENFRQFETDVLPWDPCAENNAVFCELRQLPGLCELTTACLGSDWTASGSLVMLSRGGGQGQAWHQDCPADDPHAFNLNRLLYTQDVSAVEGAIVLLPGSQRLGRIPPGPSQETMAGELVLEPRAGTLVLLHGHVFHRVTPNHTDKPRLSVNFRAFPARVSPEVCGVGIYRNGAYDFRTGRAVDR